MPFRHAKVSAVLIILASAAIPCGAATNFVKMVGFAFQPKFLTNNVGDTVVWTNTGSTFHNVVSSNSAFASSSLFTSPGTFSVTFTNAGAYGYYCAPHRSFGMTGVIHVEGAANQPPVVSLTSPSAGATLSAPASLTLSASANDPDGSIASVEFLSGTTLLGKAQTSPYSLAVTNLAAGTYDFTARAVDNLGLSSTSPAVSVSVVAPGPIGFVPGAVWAGGNLTFQITVTPGLGYAIDQTPGFNGWLLWTNFIATEPVMTFTAPTTDSDRRFFRARLLPNP